RAWTCRRSAGLRRPPRRTSCGQVVRLELLREELVRGHLDDTSPVAEEDALDAHLREPLAAAATGRGVDRGDDEVPRPVALRDRARERRPLRADAQRIRRVLDVHALDDAAVATEHGAADVELRVG